MKRRFIPASVVLLAALGTGALAAVQIRIFELGPDVIAEAVGSLSLPPPVSTTPTHCGGTPGLFPNGAIAPSIGAICVGRGSSGFSYSIAGPQTIGLGAARPADESSGELFGLNSTLSLLATAGPEVDARSTWRNASIQTLGLRRETTTWSLTNGETVTLEVVPAPMGLLGATGGWAFARRLRARIRRGR